MFPLKKILLYFHEVHFRKGHGPENVVFVGFGDRWNQWLYEVPHRLGVQLDLRLGMAVHPETQIVKDCASLSSNRTRCRSTRADAPVPSPWQPRGRADADRLQTPVRMKPSDPSTAPWTRVNPTLPRNPGGSPWTDHGTRQECETPRATASSVPKFH